MTRTRRQVGRAVTGVMLVVLAAGACTDGRQTAGAQRSAAPATPSAAAVDTPSTTASDGSPAESALPGTATRVHTPNAALAVVDAERRGVPVLTMPGGARTSATVWAGTDRLIATGRARQLPDGVWIEVATSPQRTVGWARSRTLVRTSIPEDVTAALANRLGGLPPAAGLRDLGRAIAESEAARYPGATVSLARPPLVEVVGDIAFDVEVPDDDVIRGIRLRVIGQPLDAGQQVRVLAVERSLLCRGDAVTPDGTCDLRCVYAHESPQWRMADDPVQDGSRGDA